MQLGANIEGEGDQLGVTEREKLGEGVVEGDLDSVGQLELVAVLVGVRLGVILIAGVLLGVRVRVAHAVRVGVVDAGAIAGVTDPVAPGIGTVSLHSDANGI